MAAAAWTPIVFAFQDRVLRIPTALCAPVLASAVGLLALLLRRHRAGYLLAAATAPSISMVATFLFSIAFERVSGRLLSWSGHPQHVMALPWGWALGATYAPILAGAALCAGRETRSPARTFGAAPLLVLLSIVAPAAALGIGLAQKHDGWQIAFVVCGAFAVTCTCRVLEILKEARFLERVGMGCVKGLAVVPARDDDVAQLAWPLCPGELHETAIVRPGTAEVLYRDQPRRTVLRLLRDDPLLEADRLRRRVLPWVVLAAADAAAAGFLAGFC